MKILYIANIRLPTEKAHGIQIMKMCEAFASTGVDVELVVPRRLNTIKQNTFEYYNVQENFKITRLPTLDMVRFGKFGFLIQSISFANLATIYSLFKKQDVIYSRDEIALYFLSFFRKNLVWETHTAKTNFIAKRVINKSKKNVSITQGLKDFYIKNYEINSKKVLVAPDGVDLEDFQIEKNKSKNRVKLNLPQDKKIILYTGHLYSWKGVNTLIDSARFLDKDTKLYLVGGTEKDIAKIKKQTLKDESIVVIGNKPHSEIFYWQKSADVLIISNTAREDISKYYTSPMKLFEYMASETPIVSTSLPSIKEVLNENNSVLVEPDNPKKLAEGINKVLKDKELGKRISKQARLDVMDYTWAKRAKNILN